MKTPHARPATLALVAAGLFTAHLATAATIVWSGASGTDTKWSRTGNWTGEVVPGSADNVKFYDDGADAAVSNINNVVDAAFVGSVLSLQYANTNNNHTTLIEAGVTLTNLGSFIVGTEAIAAGNLTATFTGPGKLMLGPSTTSMMVRQGGDATSRRATLDLSGLDTFVADVDRIYIGRADPTGVPNINRNTGWLYLAKTNRVRVSSSTANPSNTGIEVGRSGSNNGNGSRLYLGQTNEIYAASLGIGLEKETGCQMLFNPLFTDPALYLRGADGSSRMSLWTVGDGESNSGTTSCQGTCDLSGGSVNALVDVMTVGRASSNTSGTGGSRGTLTFDRGTLDINTLQVGLQTVNTGKNGDGTVNVRNNAMVIVNTSLQLGQATGGAGAATTVGRLNIDGGTVQAYAIATTNISGNGRGSFITLVNGGTLVLTTIGGSALSALSDFSISDSTLTIFFPDQGTTNLMVDNLTPGGNGNTLTVGFLPGITSYPATFPLISYTNLLSGLNFTASLPAGYTGSIVNDSARRLVSLVISSGPVPKAISWRGTPTGNWNTSDLNWLASGSPSAYAQGDFVTFDDTASGTTTVNLPAPLMPGSLTINNSTKTYTFTGNGRFSGFFDLIKQGAGTLILDTVGVNDFVGDIAIANGTVQVGNADGNGNLNGGAISLAAGSTLAFNKATALTVANGISGSGHLNQNGSAAVTLSGANTAYTGAVSVAQGTLKLGHTFALGTTNAGVTVANGATLDFNGFGPTNIAITVSGSGLDGNGALVNTGPSIYPSVARVTLAGHTTFGGSGSGGRWDIRYAASSATDPALASLSTGGNAYNLTKVGSNFVGIVSATVDPNLADINVLGGTLGVEGNTIGLGNPANTLTVAAGAALQLYNLTNQVNKIVVLDGNGTNSTMINASGANTILGPITLNGTSVFSGNGTSLTLSGAIGGAGGLSKTSSGVLVLAGNNTYSGSTIVNTGMLAIVGMNAGGGLLTNASGSTIVGTGTHSGPVFIAGTLNPGNINVAGAFSCGPLTLSSGGTLTLDLGATTTPDGSVNDLMNVAGDLVLNNNSVAINLLQGTLAPGSYRLINYSGNLVGSFNPAVALAVGGSSRYTLTLDTSTPQQVNLIVSGSPATVKWNSTADSTWDVASTANWLNVGTGDTTVFAQADSVLLDDTPGVQPNLTLGAIVVPSAVTVNSALNNFSITGAGKISGATSIIKQGASMLLLGTTNDFLGPVLVQGGILQVTNNSALGATNSGTIISSGATLDVCGAAANNTLNLGLEPVIVSGAGVSGIGAIINSSTTISQNAALRLVTLADDTTFGGTGISTVSSQPGRWDIRSPSTGDPSQSRLSTGGHAYKLTKVGPNQISLVGTSVDPALGDIDVQQGFLGFETATTSMGNPANSLTVRAGATLSFYNTTNQWDKHLVLYGDGVSTNVYNWSGSNTLIGPVTLNNDCVVAVRGTALTFTGVLGGSGGLVKSQPNSLYLYGANTYSGNTQVKAGTLFLAGSASLANSAVISVSSGAALDVTGVGGTCTLASGQTLTGSGTVRGSVTANSGSSIVAGDTPGTALVVTNSLALNSSSNAFSISAGAGDTVLAVSNNLTLSGVTHLYVAVNGTLNLYDTHTIITYGGSLSGSAANFQVHASPGYSFSIDTSMPHAIQVQVTAVPPNVFWVGNVSGAWDTTTFNWIAADYSTSTRYSDLTVANFGDWPAPARYSVSLSGDLRPAAVVFNNNSADFTFTGPGRLTGGAGLVHQGAARVVLDNAGANDYSGGTAIAYGVLQVGNNDTYGSLGSGSISNNGALVVSRADDLTLSNTIFGTGSFTNLGSGRVTLSANNPLSGEFTVVRGTLRVDNTGALGGNTPGGTTIVPGATLDLGGPSLAANTLYLTNEQITVSGAGVGGIGAIINSSTNRQYNALTKVTLTGDTTIGGPGSWSPSAQPGRWDIRYTPTTGTGGSLSTAYMPYNLTKVGSNQVSLVGLTIDATPQMSLANIDVQQGLLGFEGGTTSMGDPGSNLVVHAGAAISFYNTTTLWNKVFVLYGDGYNTNIFNWAGNNTLIGPVTLNSGCVFASAAGTLTNNGNLGGSGSLIKNGPGALSLGGANSYAGNTVVNDGRLSFATGSTLPASPVFDLAGTNAILDLNGVGGTLTLNSGQTLRGKGALWASLTANPGSTVAPGESIGTLTITNDVVLNGTTVMELDRATASKSDQIVTPRSLTVNGTLTINNLGAGFAAGDTFKLFSASSYSGSALASVVLPAPGTGLAWTNSLAFDGKIAVYATVASWPTNLTCHYNGSRLTLSWPADHTGWVLQTNVVDVAKPSFWYPFPGSAAVHEVNINVDPNQPKVFYRLLRPF